MTLTKFVRASAATVGALAMATQVNAADLYSGGMKDAPVFVPPPTWTGFYLGAHVGGFWADIKNTDINDYMGHGINDWGWHNNNDGVFGGGTVGYNFQSSAFVFGVEADFGGAGLTGNWNNGLATNNVDYLYAKNNAAFYADVTGRLGYAAGPALFYAKGGWAYLDLNLEVGGWDNVNGRAWSVRSNGLDGWTVGGGIEYMWTPNWSVKAEYLYFDFGKNNESWFGYGQNWGFERDLTVNSFKVGVNYHFNSVYTPLK